MITKWDSIAEFVQTAKDYKHSQRGYGSASWFGGLTFDECLNKAIMGDDSLVPQAEALLDQLDANVEVSQRSWVPSIYGAYPIVAEFLAGDINCMRRMYPDVLETAPLAIYVSTTSSAMISSDVMLKRGIAILALLMKMQQIRPIELYLVTELDGTDNGETIQVIRVESRPLAIGQACFVLSQVGFARHLTYTVARGMNNYSGGWPREYEFDDTKLWEAKIREKLGMSSNDLYIKAAQVWDPMVADPVNWVNEQVRKFGKLED